MSQSDPPAPLVSFAVPVWNGARTLPRLLASLRAQDLEDIEIVVCDNCSTDETSEILRSLARRDPRVRHLRTDQNIGQIANFNRALELSRGRYVRWIGADDWLEPAYARRCVEAMERAPHAVGVTTFQDHVEDDGTRHYAEYTGERLDSEDPVVRYRRMLWFFTADFRYADPIYAMFRRDALARTRRFMMVPAMDQVLAAELALLGPFLHVPECLAHRGKENVSPQERLRRYHQDPKRSRELDQLARAWVTLTAMWESIQHADLRPRARAECGAALTRYLVRMYGTMLAWRTRARLRAARRSAMSALGARREPSSTRPRDDVVASEGAPSGERRRRSDRAA